ncbi:hypothetical protein [Serratia marcescens]|uniref:hypothetical protein n=1 Tax=Serratia marcescens TaxID=615 RepID=UPI0027E4C57D|nr:hypothetical protein [Serratia marcescens]
MKSITRNNLVAVLVLGALGAPLSAYASDRAVVNITATVSEKFSLVVDKTIAGFADGGSDEVKITTTSNATRHGAGATLTIESNVPASGKTMQLKHVTAAITDTYPVDVKIGNADANFNSTTKKTTHTVASNNSANTQETVLKFTSNRAAQTLPAGEYKGILTIVVSPA